MKKVKRGFYNRDAIIVAREMIGKTLVHDMNGQRITGMIVETEAYMGIDDKASHSYGGKRTPRVEVMYGHPGFSYVFMIYGMYYCFNAITKKQGNPQAVLIRAVQPLEGMEWMAQRRFNQPYGQLAANRRRNLTNGPGKLCAAMAIDCSFNGIDLCGDRLYLEHEKNQGFTIIETQRVGIDYAQEARKYPWRFYIKDNDCVSVK